MDTRAKRVMGLRLAALAIAFYAGGAAAQPAGGEGHRGPPAEALAACKALAAGAACSFSGREGRQVEGTCWAPPDKALACKPAHAPDGQGERKPPPR